MALPNLEEAHAHALKQVQSFLRHDRGKDGLPVIFIEKLKELAKAKLTGNGSRSLLDSFPKDLIIGELKTPAYRNICEDLGGNLKMESAVGIYNEAINDMVKAAGYTTGLGAA